MLLLMGCQSAPEDESAPAPTATKRADMTSVPQSTSAPTLTPQPPLTAHERSTTIEPMAADGTLDAPEVVIVGAGPTGLMLAGELALVGIDVAVLERRPDPYPPGSCAGGLGRPTG